MINYEPSEEFRLETIKNMPEPDPKDYIDFTPMQMVKIFLGCVVGLIVITILYKIDKLEAQQVEQGQDIINLLK